MSKKGWKKLIFIIGTLRIFTPFFIFRFPVITTLFYCLVLDNPDGLVFYKSGGNYRQYLFYDKILDLYWYFFILLFFKSTPAYYVVLILFLYRFVGQIVVWITNNTKLYIIFPGVIEVYLYVYLAYTRFIFPEKNLFDPIEHIKILLITVGITLIREYIIHVKKVKIGKTFFLQSPGWKE